jgi:hypothetical protein
MRRVPRLPLAPPVLWESGKRSGPGGLRPRALNKPSRAARASRRWPPWSHRLHGQVNPWKGRLV